MLVAYHDIPALVKETNGEKLTIELISGKTKKVSNKDVLILSKNINSWENFEINQDSYENAEIEDTLEFLNEEALELSDVAELLYSKVDIQSVWNTYCIFNEGIYFKGSVEAIEANSKDFIDKTLKERKEKEKARVDYKNFIERLKNKEIIESDVPKLLELEKIALSKTTQSKLLKELSMESNPLKMHLYLLELGVWNDTVNPYPIRQECFLENLEDTELIPSKTEIERKDLTHLETYAIDAKETHDPDDAISLDGEYLWIHIADVSAYIEPNSEIDKEALNRGASLYLPNKVINMIPKNMIEKLALGLDKTSYALSFKIEIKDSGEAICHEITPSNICVKRLTYDEVDKLIDKKPFNLIIKKIEAFTNKRLKYGATEIYLPEVDIKVDGLPEYKKDTFLKWKSQENTPKLEFLLKNIENSPSRQLVSNTMLLTGEAVANWLHENNIPCAYVIQQAPDEIKTGENKPKTLSEKIEYIRTFKKSKLSISPEPHNGLGIERYVRVTSPLRRYVDLLIHQQIRLFLANQEVMESSEIEEKMALAEYNSSKTQIASRLSVRHFKLLYLKNNKNNIYNGILIETKGAFGIVMLEDIAIDVKVQGMKNINLDQDVKIQITGIDLPNLEAFGKHIK